MGRKTLQQNKSMFALTPAPAFQNDFGDSCLRSCTGNVTTVATVVTIPDDAIGMKIYPATYGVRFAINETPSAVGATLTGSAATVGGIAKANLWETRLIGPGTSRSLYLISPVNTVGVEVEFF